MNKYSQGKIYKIVDNTNDDIYIGSTIHILKDRLSKHKNRQSRCKSRLIIMNGDYDIVLIENYPCESKKELEMRERYWILNTECINIKIPGRTQKEYCIDNKEIRTNRSKKWQHDNKDRYLQYQKVYCIDNKEKLSDKKKQRYAYKITWGGNPKYNNLLNIDINLFR